ncbi:uncharacterized protein LOC142572781 isoform X2 [Dermacentor variabilis]|uniref:uncharacterized protein LOC142572781 isoform X2 n=1 Tax=Dermacentor variabilis TaxID=34621 RepID=UPI003F5B77EE
MLNMQRLPRISVVIGVFSLPLILGNAKNQLQPEFPDVGKARYLLLCPPRRCPGQFLFKDKNADGPLQEGTVFYSDYKDCIVAALPYGNSQECMLWISWEAKNKVLERCTDEYEDKCEDAKQTFDDETCSPFFKVNGS